jgi:hypothetical protein
MSIESSDCVNLSTVGRRGKLKPIIVENGEEFPQTDICESPTISKKFSAKLKSEAELRNL